MTTFIIGPDVGNEKLEAAFAGAVYPLELAVKNLMPRPFRHSPLEIDLKNCMGGIGMETTVNIGEFAQLQKLFTEAAAIGRLNSYPEVLELRATIPVTKDLPPDDSDAASDGLNTGGGEELPPVGDVAVSDGGADGEALATGSDEVLPVGDNTAVSGDGGQVGADSGGADGEALATGGGESPATVDKPKNKKGGK